MSNIDFDMNVLVSKAEHAIARNGSFTNDHFRKHTRALYAAVRDGGLDAAIDYIINNAVCVTYDMINEVTLSMLCYDVPRDMLGDDINVKLADVNFRLVTNNNLFKNNDLVNK